MPYEQSLSSENKQERLEAITQLKNPEITVEEFKTILKKTFKKTVTREEYESSDAREDFRNGPSRRIQVTKEEDFALLNSEDLKTLYLDLFRQAYLEIAEESQSKISKLKLSALEEHMKYMHRETAIKARSILFDEILKEEKEEIREKKITALLSIVSFVEIEQETYKRIAQTCPHRLLEFNLSKVDYAQTIFAMTRAIERINNLDNQNERDREALNQLQLALVKAFKGELINSVPEIYKLKTIEDVRKSIIKAISESSINTCIRILKIIHDPYLRREILNINTALYNPNNDAQVKQVAQQLKDSLTKEAQLATQAINGNIAAIEQAEIRKAKNGKGMIVNAYAYVLNPATVILDPEKEPHYAFIKKRKFRSKKGDKYDALIVLRDYLTSNLQAIRKLRETDEYRNLDLTTLFLLHMKLDKKIDSKVLKKFKESLISYMKSQQKFHEAQIEAEIERIETTVDDIIKNKQRKPEQEEKTAHVFTKSEKTKLHDSEVLLKKHNNQLKNTIKNEEYFIPLIAEAMVLQMLKPLKRTEKEPQILTQLDILEEEKDAKVISFKNEIEKAIKALSQKERDAAFQLHIHDENSIVRDQLMLGYISSDALIEMIVKTTYEQYSLYLNKFFAQEVDPDKILTLTKKIIQQSLSPWASYRYDDRLIRTLEKINSLPKEAQQNILNKLDIKEIEKIHDIMPSLSHKTLLVLSSYPQFRYGALVSLIQNKKDEDRKDHNEIESYLRQLLESEAAMESKSTNESRNYQVNQVAKLVAYFVENYEDLDSINSLEHVKYGIIMEAINNGKRKIDGLSKALRARHDFKQDQIDKVFKLNRKSRDLNDQTRYSYSPPTSTATFEILIDCVSPTVLINEYLNAANVYVHNKNEYKFRLYFDSVMKLNLNENEYERIAAGLLNFTNQSGNWNYVKRFLDEIKKHNPKVLGKFLYYATKANQPEIVNALLNKNAQISYKESDKTSLSYAIEQKNDLIVDSLLKEIEEEKSVERIKEFISNDLPLLSLQNTNETLVNKIFSIFKLHIKNHPELLKDIPPNLLMSISKICFLYAKDLEEAQYYYGLFISLNPKNEFLNLNVSHSSKWLTKPENEWLIDFLAAKIKENPALQTPEHQVMFGEFLLNAVKSQEIDFPRLRLLFAINSATNWRTEPDHNRPIHFAINKPTVLNMLLDANADVNIENKDGDSPLLLAIKQKDIDQVSIEKILKKCNPETINKALAFAITSGKTNALKIILDRVNIDFTKSILQQYNMQTRLSKPTTPLNLAIQHNNIEAVAHLLAKGAIATEDDLLLVNHSYHKNLRHALPATTEKQTKALQEIFEPVSDKISMADFLNTCKTDKVVAVQNILLLVIRDNEMKSENKIALIRGLLINNILNLSIPELREVALLRNENGTPIFESLFQDEIFSKLTANDIKILFSTNKLELPAEYLQKILRFQMRNGDTILHVLFKDKKFSALDLRHKFDILHNLVKNGADPKIKNYLYQSPAFFALAKGELVSAQYLDAQYKDQFYLEKLSFLSKFETEFKNDVAISLSSDVAGALLGELKSIQKLTESYNRSFSLDDLGKCMLMHMFGYIAGPEEDKQAHFAYINAHTLMTKVSAQGHNLQKLKDYLKYNNGIHLDEMRRLKEQHPYLDLPTIMLLQISKKSFYANRSDIIAIDTAHKCLSLLMDDLGLSHAQAGEEIRQRQEIINRVTAQNNMAEEQKIISQEGLPPSYYEPPAYDDNQEIDFYPEVPKIVLPSAPVLDFDVVKREIKEEPSPSIEHTNSADEVIDTFAVVKPESKEEPSPSIEDTNSEDNVTEVVTPRNEIPSAPPLPPEATPIPAPSAPYISQMPPIVPFEREPRYAEIAPPIAHPAEPEPVVAIHMPAAPASSNVENKEPSIAGHPSSLFPTPKPTPSPDDFADLDMTLGIKEDPNQPLPEREANQKLLEKEANQALEELAERAAKLMNPPAVEPKKEKEKKLVKR